MRGTHHWPTKRPLWILVQTTSSPVPPRLTSNTCTKAETCLTGSVKRHEKSLGCSPSYEKADTVASGSTDCTANEPGAVTTLKRHCVVTCWRDCTKRAWPRCIS